MVMRPLDRISNLSTTRQQFASHTLHRTVSFGGILFVPVLIQRIRDLGEPHSVFDLFRRLSCAVLDICQTTFMLN
jgi:hypothetical protein